KTNMLQHRHARQVGICYSKVRLAISIEVSDRNRTYVDADWINRRLGETGSGTALRGRGSPQPSQHHGQDKYRNRYESHLKFFGNLSLSNLTDNRSSRKSNG